MEGIKLLVKLYSGENDTLDGTTLLILDLTHTELCWMWEEEVYGASVKKHLCLISLFPWK